MVNPRAERSRLGDLLVEMRLVDADTLSSAIAEHKSSGRRLPRVLAERRVLDEERLAKAVAAKLGLEAVNVGTLKIHERVLALVPAEVARKYGVLPIAIKRTNNAELLYLVMVDPLDTEAIGEVQRLTGRQVRVLMATSSDVDHAIESQYRRAAAHLAQTAPPRAPQPPAAAQPPRPPPIRRSQEMPASSAASTPAAPAPASPPPAPSVPNAVTAPGGVDGAPPIVRGTPAPPPAPTPSSERRIPSREQATLIDSERPPEVQALANVTTSERPTITGLDDEPLVMPQDLDHPDAVHTRIDPGPFAKLEQSDVGAASKQDLDRDWDLAVRAWDDFGSESAREGGETQKPSSNEESSFDRLEIDEDENTGDDGEDLKTSQVDVGELQQQELARAKAAAPQPPEPPPPARAGGRPERKRHLLSTLEVPVDVQEEYHPFDGPSVEEIPVGLERTGIIPAIDWEKEEFEPPPLETTADEEKKKKKKNKSLAGTSDIPTSPEAVRARFDELGTPKPKSADDDVIEAIEEVSLEPLDPDDVVRFEEPEEYGGSGKPGASTKGPAPVKPAASPKPPAPAKPPAPPKLPLPKPTATLKPPSKVLPPLPTPTPPQAEAQSELPATDPKLVPPSEPEPPRSSAAGSIAPADDSDADRIPVIEPSSLVSLEGRRDRAQRRRHRRGRDADGAVARRAGACDAAVRRVEPAGGAGAGDGQGGVRGGADEPADRHEHRAGRARRGAGHEGADGRHGAGAGHRRRDAAARSADADPARQDLARRADRRRRAPRGADALAGHRRSRVRAERAGRCVPRAVAGQEGARGSEVDGAARAEGRGAGEGAGGERGRDPPRRRAGGGRLADQRGARAAAARARSRAAREGHHLARGSDPRARPVILAGVDLKKSYGDRVALDGVSLEVAGSEVLGVVGESGAGKSTLVRILAALERPDAGRVELEGVDLASLAPHALRTRRRDLQVVFQDAGASLSPRWTVRSILAEPWQVRGRRATEQELTEALDRVHLEPRVLDLRRHELSGGQKQRVAIARALATTPRLLILDEPLASLDVSVAAQVLELLAELRERLSVAMLFVTHDLRAVRHLADRVAVMAAGRIVETAPTAALFDDPASEEARSLVSALPSLPALE